MAPKKSTKVDKVRKTKKDKDPNRPKRPKSGYFLFLDALRAASKNDEEGCISKSLSVTEFSREAGARWKALDEDEAKEYKDRAAELKKEYEKVIVEYEKKLKKDSKKDSKEE